MSEIDIALEKIGVLVRDFQSHESHYKSATYQEAEARKDFIDKFWIALGWDVNHEQQTNPYEQEVKVERGVTVGGNQRRADYAFYLKPNYHDVRFLVEAKKPSGELAINENYFQLIRYSWNSNIPLAVLTDFEELHILDCRYRPDLGTALDRAIRKFHYTDYTNREKLAEIYWLFSREAVADGSIEKRAKELPKPRGKAVQRGLFPGGYQSIDETFLAELDDYRKTLASAFKNRNPGLDSETLTELAQRTLDRLVFLRFLEDKGIEPKRLVESFGDKGTAWQDFVTTCRRLNGIYNGIVYKWHTILDSPKFRVDDTAFARICKSLAYINSSYDFNAIPIHILGSIYERFLGKVIVATDKRARVQEKPEVRKAGGVYYTPEYIVRYIVDNTVGKLIAGKTPKEIAEMRFADIACGSGSFLLGVFDLLLKYHGHYYNENPSKARKGDCIKREGRLYLSLRKKREILLNNIYGVDIDAQAVEVCQLSLYLKLLQEETEASTHQYILDFEHIAKMKKLLPDLNKNIVCGNSLIGTDILDGQLFAGDEERKLNPMNFEDAFPKVMKHGGFDAIVGNPPYIRMEVFKPLKEYLRQRYSSHEERSDLYVYFVERANRLLKTGGHFGMIVSNKFLRAKYGKPLREFLRTNVSIIRVTDFAGLPVFKGATVRTIVLVAERGVHHTPFVYSPPLPLQKFSEVETGLSSVEQVCNARAYKVAPAILTQQVWSFARSDVNDLLGRLKSKSQLLVEYAEGKICMGVKSGLKEAFEIDAQTRAGIIACNPEAKEIIKPFLNGRDVRRYRIEDHNGFLIYTYHGIAMNKYPAVKKHLEAFKTRLRERATKQAWYELQQPQLRFAPYMDSPKIIFPDIATQPRFAFDEKGFYGSNTTYFIALGDLYLLGLLNSSLGLFYFRTVCAGLEGKNEVYLRFFGQYLEGFPVRRIEFSDAAEKKRHDAVVAKVEAMLEAKKQLAKAQTDKDKTYYENKCDALDRQIDRLVYDLYDLTEDEIKLVEESTK